MSDLNHVAKLARILRAVTIVTMIVFPVLVIAAVVTVPLTPETIDTPFSVSPHATRAQLLAAVMIGLLSPIILLWTMNEMRKLFGAYALGEVLTDHCAQLILRIGKGFLTLAIASFLLQPIQILLLSLANPAGERMISIGLNNDMIFFAMSGGLIIVIGWAMREASAVASENRSFV